MFNVLGDINWLGVLVAFVAFAALGFVYFTFVVPKYYVIALGRENAPAPEQTLIAGLGPVVCIALTTVTSAVMLRALDVTRMSDALVFGLIVGIGYLGTTMLNIAINPNFPRPLYYAALNAPFFVGGSVITSLILVAV